MRVRYTPKALEDLQKTKEYIIGEFDSTELADKILRKIIRSINNLEIFPYKGGRLKETIDIETNYRYLVSQKNYIFYIIEDEEILVIRVLNEKQDYMQILFEKTETK